MTEKTFPREKALMYGITSLDDNELLALIIKSAYRDSNVFRLADAVLERANGFQNLFSLTYEELVSIKGIKTAKALEIMAILEIAKRLAKVDRIAEPDLDNPSKVVTWLRFSLGYSDKEEFFVVYLNGKGSIIKSEVLHRGNKNSSVVGIDDVMRMAILTKASYLLVAHNHPSDNTKPSQADIDITNNLLKAGKMLGIPLIDHIIIGKTTYFSFKNHGMIK